MSSLKRSESWNWMQMSHSCGTTVRSWTKPYKAAKLALGSDPRSVNLYHMPHLMGEDQRSLDLRVVWLCFLQDQMCNVDNAMLEQVRRPGDRRQGGDGISRVLAGPGQGYDEV